MTVLQVCAYAAPYEGNFIKALKGLGKVLEDKGHKMIYAFPETAKSETWCKELEKHTNVYYLPLAKARIRYCTYVALREIYKKHPDLNIIHSHFELYDVPVSITAPKNIKVFWHLHDALEMYNSLKHKIVHRVQYGLMHKDAILLSVSQKHMDYVLRLGFPKKNAKYVPNGLNVERIQLVRSDYKNREYDFLMFGWEFERKGVDLCIEATKAFSKNVKVAIVGSNQTRELIYERYGDIKNIDVIAPVEDINELYNRSKCFLHISRAEGLSYALLEAIYAGLPVICSDISENMFAQVFPTVSMVASENVKAIAKEMEKQMKVTDCNMENILSARSMIDNEYTLACWTKNVLNYYEV